MNENVKQGEVIDVRSPHQMPAPPTAPMSQVPQVASEPDALISMIERAARDPAVDIAKMRELMAMRKEFVADAAKVAFDAAFSEMQPELPIVDRKGRIEVREKDNAGKRTGAVQQSTPYALWEDMNEAIRPILHKHGFGLSFRTGLAQDGKITVTGILSHREGHREDTTITLMHDSSGSKNAVQAVGSSVSYGKRYTAMMLLNITTRGEDDDGKTGGGGPAVISDDQAHQLGELIKETKSDLGMFLRIAGVECLADIPATQYGPLARMLEQKKNAKRAKKETEA